MGVSYFQATGDISPGSGISTLEKRSRIFKDTKVRLLRRATGPTLPAFSHHRRTRLCVRGMCAQAYQLRFAAPDEVLSCCWSTDGLRVLAACKDNSVLLWDARAPEVPTHVLSGHSEWVTCVDISEDGAQILSGSVDRTLKVSSALDRGICPLCCERLFIRSWSHVAADMGFSHRHSNRDV